MVDTGIVEAAQIDTGWSGLDRVIVAWERDGTLVDPGPAKTADTVIGALEERGVEPEAILLTHIHLDHAGGAGALLERYPSARAYVHEIGRPHLTDPTRLWESASRLYGADRMEEMWGRMLPADPARVVGLRGGERVAGLEVIATPGHASHHVVYLDDEEGSAYVGDVAGVRIAGSELTVMPTPPPEIDVDAWLASIQRLRERRPERLLLTHSGEARDAGAQLEAAERALRWAAELAAGGDRAAFLDALEARIDSQAPPEAERMRAAMAPEQVWLGLERYWRKLRDADR